MPECFGDGSGPLIASGVAPEYAVKVCGRDQDLISYWQGNTRLFVDEIRDGDFLNAEDIRFPSQATDLNPPFSVRHGRLRDLLRVYAPRSQFGPATVNRFEIRKNPDIIIDWLDSDLVQVLWYEGRGPGITQRLRLDRVENAFLREGVPRNLQDIRVLG